MTIKNIDLLRCVEPMKQICEKSNIPFLSALAISKNASAIDSAIENYFSAKKELDEKCLIINADRQELKKGMEEQYLKELTELNAKEVSVPIEKLSPNSLSDITFIPKYIDSIAFMLEL